LDDHRRYRTETEVGARVTLPLDVELAETFAFHWNDRLAHLPASERLPAVMAVIRRALVPGSDEGTAPGRRRGTATSKDREALKLRPAVERLSLALGYSYEAICADDRSAGVKDARHRVVWALCRVLGASRTMCGLAVGGRDHSTAIHSIRIVDKLVAGQPELAEFLTAVARGDEMALRRMRAVG
jgi:hypothetical protein